MRNVLQYFDLLARVIELSPAIDPKLELDQAGTPINEHDDPTQKTD